MTTPATQQNESLTVKGLFSQEVVKAKFTELLGQKAQGFMTSVLQIATNDSLLMKADPWSIYNAAAIAATLDLPINPNLGFAYILPYSGKASFQMGYKGFIQLAQRSGQFEQLEAKPVYEGQYVVDNTFLGFHFEWASKTSEVIIGYAAYFKLLNGFEKTLFMSVKDLEKHGKKFSQTFKKGFGLWKDDFDSMAIKTVIKLLLSKFAPLSIAMQTAVIADQSVPDNDKGDSFTYIDNQEINKEEERIQLLIENAETITELQSYKKDLPESLVTVYELKMQDLKEVGNG